MLPACEVAGIFLFAHGFLVLCTPCSPHNTKLGVKPWLFSMASTHILCVRVTFARGCPALTFREVRFLVAFADDSIWQCRHGQYRLCVSTAQDYGACCGALKCMRRTLACALIILHS